MADYKDTVVETQPTDPEGSGGRNWLRLIGLALAAIIVAALLVLAARFVYNAVTDNNSERGGNVQPADEEQLPAGPGEEGGQPDTGGGSSGTPTPDNDDQAGSQQTPRTGSQLPNSGPAHVAAVFAGSSLAGAGLHYIINRRRNS